MVRGVVALTVYSPARNRVYVRRFDHEEATARYAAGETVKELAASYGVTPNAVYRAITPGYKEREQATAKRWRTGLCERCGGPAMRLIAGKKEHNPDGRVLCLRCRGRERRKRLRVDPSTNTYKLECGRCKHWKTVAEFGERVRKALANGEAPKYVCTACATTARQTYRNRHRVPCDRCGKPCLPPSEKGSRCVRTDRNMCLSCYRETELPEHRQRAVEASAAARRARASLR